MSVINNEIGYIEFVNPNAQRVSFPKNRSTLTYDKYILIRYDEFTFPIKDIGDISAINDLGNPIAVPGDLANLYLLLRTFFFRITSIYNPLIPDSQRVDNYSVLPTPASNYDGQYWVTDNTYKTGIWPARTVYSPGIYKSVSNQWVYKGADVPAFLIDDTLIIKDELSGFGLGLILDGLTANRQVTFPNKNGTPQYFDDLSVYEGQVKILTGNAVKPTLSWTIVDLGVFKRIEYQSPLAYSASPITQWPENIISPSDSDIVDFTNHTFIENTILGQINIWRLLFDFSGKAVGNSTGVIVRLQNTLSGFSVDRLINIPDERTDGQFSALFHTIADQASLPSPFGTGQGYEIILTVDDPITIQLDTITRINNVKHIR